MSASPPRLGERSSGVLLHVPSLPGASCCGDMGQGARDFIDFLAAAGQRWWLMLPLNPIDRHNSPYSSLSAFAGEPLLIDLRDWVEQGLLDKGDIVYAPQGPLGRIAYTAARDYRQSRWRKAFDRFRQKVRSGQRDDLERFVDENRAWLEDHALFCSLVDKLGTAEWTEWPQPLRDREPGALAEIARELRDQVAYHIFLQYQFNAQWQRLRHYARERGVALIGDLPIYIAHGSVNVWANRRYFILDDQGRPTYVAGVPGDAFNPNGQRWNSPLYRWDIMQQDGFQWWMQRLESMFRYVDAVRLDHFIGFHNYYQLPADENSTVGQGWFPTPGYDFFRIVKENFPDAQFIAEDLGAMSEGVKNLRDTFGFPGMNVIQFDFHGRKPEDGPVFDSWKENSIACSGTHDNNTIVGWFRQEVAPPSARDDLKLDYDYIIDSLNLRDLLTWRETHPEQVQVTHDVDSELAWRVVERIAHSPPHTAIFPMQDLLGLSQDARMNWPGFSEGNWGWRLRPDDMTDELADRLRRVTAESGRLPS